MLLRIVGAPLSKLAESSETGFVLKLWSGTLAFHWSLALAAVAFFAPGRDYRITGSWADLWLRSDGVQYVRIAQYGYYPDRMGTEGWFPGYPLCIRLAAPVFGYEASAVIISHLCFLLGLSVLWRLLALDVSPERVQRCLLVLAVFPTSFFFSSSYSESLFLLLVASAFLAARRNRWRLACVIAALACGVRPVGIILLPAFLWEWSQQPNRRFAVLAWFALLPVPIVLFFWHLQSTIGNFWGYLRFQTDMADRIGSWNHLHLPGVLGILFGLVALVLLWVGRSRLRGSYRIYLGLSLLLPFLHSLWTSQPRYSLVLFPLLLVIEPALRGRRFYWWLGLSLLAQGAATISFVSGIQVFF